MTNEQAKWELEHIYGMVAPDVQRALDIAIDALNLMPIALNALEQEQLDINALKRDLPELFKPHYDGGYLKEGEEA